METIGVSEEVKEKLGHVKENGGHTSYDSAIRELLFYRYTVKKSELENELDVVKEFENEE